MEIPSLIDPSNQNQPTPASLERFQAQIAITHVKGERIGYLYTREDFNALGISRDPYDNSQWIKPGTKFQLNGKSYLVVRFSFMLEEKFLGAGLGPKEESPTPNHGYNCMLEIVVDSQ